MATDEQAAATTAGLREAVERGDVGAFMHTLAPGAVLHSPITTTFRFEGADQIRALMREALDVIDDIRYTDDVGDARTRALFYTARIGTVEVEEATPLAAMTRSGDRVAVRLVRPGAP